MKYGTNLFSCTQKHSGFFTRRQQKLTKGIIIKMELHRADAQTSANTVLHNPLLLSIKQNANVNIKDL